MTDEMIMEAVKNGDLKQASLLFERYNKRIFNFLARMTLDRALAEDLTQNVFLRIIKYRNSYREGLRFQSWIYQVARNIFSDHYQMHKNRFSAFVDVDKISENISEASDSEKLDEQEKLLERSMAMLSEEQRELLILTRFQHMKYEDVAVIMDTTVANIKVKVHRAITKLREYYFQLEKI
ncbi:sigma-70 family RNA polymerase sigma factor [Chryseolinea sp. H1M3-3]|uniref:RNA polymerase sigma factor n=1 Tax=Chryseolinea sp. H1M3-3 TaxID=3034144 RepID=UPI0023EDEE8B|nr:sigma-70 family RNA polymerase sigma factor [Chryseolinea sp. H1M3-3]